MLSPRRASAAVAALCAAGVAVALGVTTAVERAQARSGGPAAARFAPAPIAKLDLHQHVDAGATGEAVRLARSQGIAALVNLSGGPAGGPLERALEAAATQGGRVVVLMNVDPDGCCDEAWARREVERLEEGKRLGARGLALGEGPGAAAAGAPLDDAALDPIFAACERLALPVVVEGAPRAALERRVARHPRATFVAAGFAGGADDPAAVSALLDRLPNLQVDTAAVATLGQSPAAARAAILAHPDRVLFGSDVRLVELPPDVKVVVFGGGPSGDREAMLRFFEGTWRFFETRDGDVPSPVPSEEAAPLTGIGLSREVLEQVYRRNAERLLGVRAPEERR